MGLKASTGGVGYRDTAPREALINAFANALPQMMGNEIRQPLWPSLKNVLGADSFKKKNVDTCWKNFLRLAIGMGHRIQDRDSENQGAPRTGHRSGWT